VLLKGKGTLEGKLKPLGFTVQWVEFPSGPPLLEAINAGAIDFGNTGRSSADLRAGGPCALRLCAYDHRRRGARPSWFRRTARSRPSPI